METIRIRPELKNLILEQVANSGGNPSDVIECWRLGSLNSSRGTGSLLDDQTGPEARLREFLEGPEIQRKRNAIEKYLAILTFLYSAHGDDLDRILDVGGRRRKYFSKDPELLKKSGVDVNPRRISDSPYWTISRLSNRDKRMILKRVLRHLGYGSDASELLRTVLRSG